MEWRCLGLLALWHLLLAMVVMSMCFRGTSANSYKIRIFHKFSEEVKSIMQKRTGKDLEWWPKEGTIEYTKELLRHDELRHLERRKLLDGQDPTWAFDPDNRTYEIMPLGGLHYSFVAIGNPKKVFFVALDTGSDLLWVPCECKTCANTIVSSYDLKIPGLDNFSIYSPRESSTGSKVPCASDTCRSVSGPMPCLNSSLPCSYVVNYVATNTSSSGYLVEDDVHLISGKRGQNSTTSKIVFGCGQVQTGFFIDGIAPDGLLGLGMASYSVPSSLASGGLVKGSFSICIPVSENYYGTLIFGDTANPNIPSAILQSSRLASLYVLSLETIKFSDQTLLVSSKVLFDTGTAITRFASPIFENLVNAFDQAINLEKISIQDIPLPRCWQNRSTYEYPQLTLAFTGGGSLLVDPYISFTDSSTRQTVVTCLFFIEDSISLVGYNFMKGYRWFHDRDTNTLSWQKSDICTDWSDEYTPEISPASEPSPPMQEVNLSNISKMLPPPSLPPSILAPASAPTATGSPRNKGALLSFMNYLMLVLFCIIQ